MKLPFRHLVAAGILALPVVGYAADPAASQPQDAQPAAQAAPAAPAASSAAPATQAPAATSDQAATPAATSAPAATADAAPAMVAGGKIAPPPAGKGQVVFYRERHFTGAAVVFKVREGDKVLGKLSTGVYFVAVLDPGAHDFSVHTENKDALHMEIEAGETYFVAGSISMGFLVGESHIAPSDEATFVKDLPKLTLSSN